MRSAQSVLYVATVIAQLSLYLSLTVLIISLASARSAWVTSVRRLLFARLADRKIRRFNHVQQELDLSASVASNWSDLLQQVDAFWVRVWLAMSCPLIFALGMIVATSVAESELTQLAGTVRFVAALSTVMATFLMGGIAMALFYVRRPSAGVAQRAVFLLTECHGVSSRGGAAIYADLEPLLKAALALRRWLIAFYRRSIYPATEAEGGRRILGVIESLDHALEDIPLEGQAGIPAVRTACANSVILVAALDWRVLPLSADLNNSNLDVDRAKITRRIALLTILAVIVLVSAGFFLVGEYSSAGDLAKWVPTLAILLVGGIQAANIRSAST